MRSGNTRGSWTRWTSPACAASPTRTRSGWRSWRRRADRARRPAARRAWPRRSTAPGCARCSAAPASITAGAGIRAGARSCAASTTRRSIVFIAACYTPVGMLVLSGTTRWVVLITVWAGALARRDASASPGSTRRGRLCASCYVALGWVAVLAFPQMHAALPRHAADPDRPSAACSTRRRDHLRARPPEPVAARVRLPRDLPRVRDPRRCGALRRHGRLDRHRLSWDEEYGRRGIPSSYRDEPSGAVVWAFSRGLGGSRGLDVGCGTGRNTLYAAAQGLRMTGFDRSAAAIERARARGGDAEFLVARPDRRAAGRGRLDRRAAGHLRLQARRPPGRAPRLPG